MLKLIELGVTAEELLGKEHADLLIKNSLDDTTAKTFFGVDAATHQPAPEPVSAAPSPEFLKAHPELLEGMREQLVEDLMKKDLVPKDQVKDIVRQELERILPGKTSDKI